ncbi:MAG: Flp family type IVb pilin [Rhodospirillaceae bacterium]|nr:Flp family type IVb pilin [Rhodospirillaceae bacterium]
MLRKIRKFVTGKEGATAIEYGLIAALVSVAAITALGAMGENLSTMFSTVANELDSAVDGVGAS